MVKEILFSIFMIAFIAIVPIDGRAQTPPGSGPGRDFTSRGITTASFLTRLLEIPEVRTAHEQCKNEGSSTPPAPSSPAGSATAAATPSAIMDGDRQNAIADCIWRKMGEQGKQQQILEAMNRLGSGSGSSSSEYERLDLGNVQTNSDRAVIAMRSFFKNQLEQALYGEVRANSIHTVDHAVFIKIFETRLSKNLIESITTLCYDINLVTTFSRDNGPFIIQIPTSDRDIETNRTANTALLADGNRAATLWSKCANSIKDACSYLEASDGTCGTKVTLAEVRSTPSPSGTSGSAPTSTSTATPATASGARGEAVVFCAKDDNAQRRFCEVEAHMRTTRTSLLMAKELREAFDAKAADSGAFSNTAFRGEVVVYNGGGSGQKSIDEVSTVTSKDVSDHYGSGAQAEAQRLAQACGVAASAPAGGATATGASPPPSSAGASAFNEAECRKYVMTQEQGHQAEAALSEYALRSKAQEEKMKQKLGNDRTGEELTKYLREAGYSNERIEQIKANPVEKDKIVVNILKTYEEEREQVIKSMSDRIKTRTAGQGSGSFSQETAQSTAQQLQTELATEPARYKRVVHFSNLITGFLGSTNSSSGGNNNSVSIGGGGIGVERELANSSEDAALNTRIRANIQAQGGAIGGSGSGGQSTVDVNTLNRLLIEQ